MGNLHSNNFIESSNANYIQSKYEEVNYCNTSNKNSLFPLFTNQELLEQCSHYNHSHFLQTDVSNVEFCLIKIASCFSQ